MAASQLDGILGRLVVNAQIVDQAQMQDLLNAVASMPGATLEELLADSGLVDRAQLDALVGQAKQMAARQNQRPAGAPVTSGVRLTPVSSPSPAPAPAQSGVRLQPIPSSAPAPTSSARLAPIPSGAVPVASGPRAPAFGNPTSIPGARPPAPAFGNPTSIPGARPPAPGSPAPSTSGRVAPIQQPAPPAGAQQRTASRGGIAVLPTIQIPVEEAPPPVDLDLLQPVEPEAMDALDLGLTPVEDGARMPEDFLAATPREEMELVLRIAVDMELSDLHLHSGCPVIVRKNGELRVEQTKPFEASRIERLVDAILNDQQRETLQEKGELDFAYSVPGLGRFRANVYRQHRGLDVVFRVIPAVLPTLESLGMPAHLAALTDFSNGLVLCTGPSGCGKSTTMAALVNLINQSREDHILTIEDPIEFMHKPLKCSVNQRQVGLHTTSFARALRGALREDPDVIVVGELRDLETISLALSAAETGHLVLGTLHTNSAIRTVNRLINVFPPDQQEQVRAMLSESLRGVISQRLVRKGTGQGRIPAVEIMMVNKAVSNCIKENKTISIRSILQTSTTEGMCLLDGSLAQLVKENRITREEAMRYAEEPKRFAG